MENLMSYQTALASSRVLEILKAFDATLTGTFPLSISISSSDLDVACFAPDSAVFLEVVTRNFEEHQNFRIKSRNDIGARIVSFDFMGFPFEIFSQPIPVHQQMSYRHMVAERIILDHHGDAFRCGIIILKESGLKTEPAFAKALHITGDAYHGVLDYAERLRHKQRN
ncbi:MAG: DUF4269 domain-containing protein [Flavobacterium sp.]|nr:MAG: DUF4269 domain-containing protein [Flavobacterium sp.]